jgi:hypothetical protein
MLRSLVGNAYTRRGEQIEVSKGEKKMKTKLAAAVAGGGLLLAAVPAWAHHAFAAEFDSRKPVHLEGIVTKVELINPHAWIHIDVTGQDSKVTSWMVEAGSPNVLLRRGFTKASIPPGTHAVVDGYQAKDGSNRANGRDITLPDGKKLFLGSSGTGAPYDSNKEK